MLSANDQRFDEGIKHALRRGAPFGHPSETELFKLRLLKFLSWWAETHGTVCMARTDNGARRCGNGPHGYDGLVFDHEFSPSVSIPWEGNNQ